MDIHTNANVKLLLSPRQSRGITYWIYSLVQTAKANGVEPYAWLRRVLRELPAAQTVEAVEALLPWNLRIPEILANTQH